MTNTRPLTPAVYDPDILLHLFRELMGLRLIGSVDCTGCVELVFDNPNHEGKNLLTVYTDGPSRGTVSLGHISREMIEDGYGQDG